MLPRKWLATVKESIAIVISVNAPICVKIRNKDIHISNVSTNKVYWKFANIIVERPTSLYKWEEAYYWYDFDWNYIFILLLRLQEKAIYRVYNIKYYIAFSLVMKYSTSGKVLMMLAVLHVMLLSALSTTFTIAVV